MLEWDAAITTDTVLEFTTTATEVDRAAPDLEFVFAANARNSRSNHGFHSQVMRSTLLSPTK